MRKLEDYVKTYKILDKKFCNQIRKELKNVTWSQHLFYNDKGE